MVPMHWDVAASLAGLFADFYASTVVRLVVAQLLSSAGQCGRNDRSGVSVRFDRLKSVERKIWPPGIASPLLGPQPVGALCRRIAALFSPDAHGP